jgi:predicted transposase YbfD/YdcC
MAEWGRNYGEALREALGFRQGAPCAATLHRVLRALDRARVEAVVGAWAEEVLAAVPPRRGQPEGLSADGKALRGSRKQGAPGTHLLAVLSQRLGLTLAQVAVDDKTNEIGAILAVLRGVLLVGRVVTVDALLTQRTVAQAIIDARGDYVMLAKDNQSRLRSDIGAILATPAHLAAPRRTKRTQDRGHGRIEQRHLTLRALLPGDCDWPGAQQVFRIERRRVCRKTGEVQIEVTEGVTSLSAERADPRRVLALLRAHWHIENKSHYVRDVTFDEDRSTVRAGALPQVLAAFRNLAIGVLRVAGEPNIAAATRRCAAQPWHALALLGLQRE